MNRTEFAQVMGVLTAGIGRPFKKEVLNVWYECLRDLPQHALRAAVIRWLSECDSGFPSIAALRRMACEASHGRLKSAAEAWDHVIDAVRRHGYYAKEAGMASLGETERQAVDAAGGWCWLCDVTNDNRQTMSAQFRKAYEAISERKSADRSLPDGLRPRIAVSEQPLPDAYRKRIAQIGTIPEGHSTPSGDGHAEEQDSGHVENARVRDLEEHDR